MRRKRGKDVLNENIFLMILSILAFLAGAFCVTYPFIPKTGYDSLQTKEATISEFKHVYSTKMISGYDYILTTDCEKYNLSGEYEYTRDQLRKLLTEGEQVTIKWYKNKPFGNLLAEEIYVQGERVVTYDNDEPVNMKISLIFGSFFVVVGLCGFYILVFLVKRNRKIQMHRDKKIEKKYGS